MPESLATAVEPGRAVHTVTQNEWVSADRLRVVVVDDSIVETLGMTAVLGRFADLHVVRQARGAQEALRAAAEVHAEVVLVGLALDPAAGLGLLRELRARLSNARLVAFSAVSSPALARAAYAAGATAFVLRDDDPSTLHAALLAAGAGESARMTDVRALTREGATPPAGSAGDEVLTRREIEVLGLIADGRSSREIAYQLGIRLATVNAHRASMMKKLNIHKAVGLAQYWIRRSASTV
jgi:DNA-binding NarL/FixJ family response regulator